MTEDERTNHAAREFFIEKEIQFTKTAITLHNGFFFYATKTRQTKLIMLFFLQYLLICKDFCLKCSLAALKLH